jgi:hypothetical protein
MVDRGYGLVFRHALLKLDFFLREQNAAPYKRAWFQEWSKDDKEGLVMMSNEAWVIG